METRVVIRHLNGSKANQIEQIPLNGLKQLEIGRDPTSDIAFDPQRDDSVSRHHAIITVERQDPPAFRIVDQNSSNGTFVNGLRIAGETPLTPGDTVALGSGGPSFAFELDPMPAALDGRTRIMPAAATDATRIMPAAAPQPHVGRERTGQRAQAAAPVKSGVGQETVQRMIAQATGEANRRWTGVAAGLVAALAVLGGGGYFAWQKIHPPAPHTYTAAEIASDYGNSTAQVDVHWQLTDAIQNQPIYQKMCRVAMTGPAGEIHFATVPAYIQLPNGSAIRWLTTDSADNIAVFGIGQGSGFVIRPNGGGKPDGTMLTNKHVAAGWKVAYQDDAVFEMKGIHPGSPVFIYDVRIHRGMMVSATRELIASLEHWVPEQGGLLFNDEPAPLQMDPGGKVFSGCPDMLVKTEAVPVQANNDRVEGRNTALTVQFPGSAVQVSAHLISASDQADVAVIKADSLPVGVKPIPLASPTDKLAVGDAITVLGYPALSETNALVQTSNEAGRVGERHVVKIPDPTVTDGVVQHLADPVRTRSGGTEFGTFGDAFQISAEATGAGNSGGPVISNVTGRAVGLFTYSHMPTIGERTTLAVPISEARSLLDLRKVDN